MSVIAWLDTSPNDERRMRELVKMFSEQGTLDDLGIGQIRDGFADALFPGLSTVHTCGQELPDHPLDLQGSCQESVWHCVGIQGEEGRTPANRHPAGGRSHGRPDRQSRGEQVKTLPPPIYWSALRRFKILIVERSPDQLKTTQRLMNFVVAKDLAPQIVLETHDLSALD